MYFCQFWISIEDIIMVLIADSFILKHLCWSKLDNVSQLLGSCNSRSNFNSDYTLYGTKVKAKVEKIAELPYCEEQAGQIAGEAAVVREGKY